MNQLKLSVYKKNSYGQKSKLIKEILFDKKELVWKTFLSIPNSLEQNIYYLDLVEGSGSNKNIINSKYITLSSLKYLKNNF